MDVMLFGVLLLDGWCCGKGGDVMFEWMAGGVGEETKSLLEGGVSYYSTTFCTVYIW